MLLRSRLKKELVNLLTWKNKKFLIILIIVGIVLLIISKKHSQLPEDMNLSSGNSVVRAKLEINDNYFNVKNYEYLLKEEASQKKYKLKDINYSFWEEITFPMEQYLQGICFTEMYVFISAYYEEEDILGELMVFHRETGEYLLTLGLDEDSHLGGIAFDGENIWICNSTNKAIERISYQALCLMIEGNIGEKVDITNLVDVYPVANTPSCITYYNGYLWIATHNKWTNSIMVNYVYDPKIDELEGMYFYIIPDKVQGIAFDENGKLYISSSYGRRNSSYLRRYTSAFEMTQNTKNYEILIEMPPCSEGIALYEDSLYLLFESAGKKYFAGTDGYGTSLSPLDRILIIDLKENPTM